MNRNHVRVIQIILVFFAISVVFTWGYMEVAPLIDNGSIFSTIIDDIPNLSYTKNGNINMNIMVGEGKTETAIGKVVYAYSGKAGVTDDSEYENFYNVYFYLSSSSNTLSDELANPRLYLSIKDPNGNYITEVEGLTYVEAENGFDITSVGKTQSLYKIKEQQRISVAKRGGRTEHEWEFTTRSTTIPDDFMDGYTENTTLHAVILIQEDILTGDPNIVTYDSNGGSGITVPTAFVYDSGFWYNSPNNFTKDGANWVGWHIQRTSDNYWYGCSNTAVCDNTNRTLGWYQSLTNYYTPNSENWEMSSKIANENLRCYAQWENIVTSTVTVHSPYRSAVFGTDVFELFAIKGIDKLSQYPDLYAGNGYNVYIANSSSHAVPLTDSIYGIAEFKGLYTEATGGVKVANANMIQPVLEANVAGYTDANGLWIREDDVDLYAQYGPSLVVLPAFEWCEEGYTCSYEDENGNPYNPGDEITLTEDIYMYIVVEEN